MILSPFHFMNATQSFGIMVELSILMSILYMNSNMMGLKTKYFTSVFLTVGILNLSGMMPFFWSPTSYLWNNSLVTFSLWLSLISFMMYKDFSTFLMNQLPFNTPKILWMFLIVLEMVSQTMRPFTLSLRLSCNLMSGHVMMSLLMNKSIYMIPAMIFIILFEMLVSMIQAVVFSMLMDLYSAESY